MTGILDQIARTNGLYVARAMDDVLAIALAEDLGDPTNLASYLKLVPQYPHVVLAEAAVRAKRNAAAADFHAFSHELLHGRFGGRRAQTDLIGCSVTRREVAAVVVVNGRLADAISLQLSSDQEAAERSVTAFITRQASEHPSASFGIEIDAGLPTRRTALRHVAIGAARASALPVWQITFDVLSRAFSVPPFRSREHGREIIRTVWPELAANGQSEIICNAALVAAVLYCRTLLHEEERTPT